MIGATVAEALHAGFDGAQPEGVVGMGLEGVADDVGAVQLHAGPVTGAAEFGAVVRMVECVRHARHGGRGFVGEVETGRIAALGASCAKGERSFCRMNRFRQLPRDYERIPNSWLGCIFCACCACA